MKIGAIAKRLGTTVRTLRFYEERGLVRPARSSGGTRVYGDEDEARFAALLGLSRLGFSLERLGQLAGVRAASRSGDQASRAVADQLRAMDLELAEKGRAIRRQRADIEKALAFLSGCHGCDARPTRSTCDDCEISSGWQGSVALRVVWDEPDRD